MLFLATATNFAKTMSNSEYADMITVLAVSPKGGSKIPLSHHTHYKTAGEA